MRITGLAFPIPPSASEEAAVKPLLPALDQVVLCMYNIYRTSLRIVCTYMLSTHKVRGEEREKGALGRQLEKKTTPPTQHTVVYMIL